MIDSVQALWLRAVRAADVRGILPKAKSLTPKEIADDLALRGDDRFIRLVHGWYYPTSYGRTQGALSYEEAARIVATLEADAIRKETAAVVSEEHVEEAPPPPPKKYCELCGFPVARGHT